MQNARAPNNPWGEEDWVVPSFVFVESGLERAGALKRICFMMLFLHES